MFGVARSPISPSWSLEEIMVSEGGARVAAVAGGKVRTGKVGGGARKPCVTMTMKAAPEATLVVNQ